MGAERLTGRGDMLFFDGGDTTRVQCSYISTEEVTMMCRSIGARYADATQTMMAAETQQTDSIYTMTLYKFLRSMSSMPTLISGFFRSCAGFQQAQELGVISKEVNCAGYYKLNREECERQLNIAKEKLNIK
jgi:DNA segregation ATPase FtsK/SpoIIIE-like protein